MCVHVHMYILVHSYSGTCIHGVYVPVLRTCIKSTGTGTVHINNTSTSMCHMYLWYTAVMMYILLTLTRTCCTNVTNVQLHITVTCIKNLARHMPATCTHVYTWMYVCKNNKKFFMFVLHVPVTGFISTCTPLFVYF